MGLMTMSPSNVRSVGADAHSAVERSSVAEPGAVKGDLRSSKKQCHEKMPAVPATINYCAQEIAAVVAERKRRSVSPQKVKEAIQLPQMQRIPALLSYLKDSSHSVPWNRGDAGSQLPAMAPL